MMGPGIFALPSEVSQLVGPLGIVVYMAMGLITMITALNYAELGASIPLAGGGYSFVARVLPKPVAFLTGWFFWIGNVAACAMYAVIFALTIKQYFWPEASLPLICLGCTIVFGAINLRGMSEAIMVKECVVAAVIRGKKFVVPRGDTTIEVGDEVVFVGPSSDVRDANDLFVLKG
jgi:amino acid transporter